MSTLGISIVAGIGLLVLVSLALVVLSIVRLVQDSRASLLKTAEVVLWVIVILAFQPLGSIIYLLARPKPRAGVQP